MCVVDDYLIVKYILDHLKEKSYTFSNYIRHFLLQNLIRFIRDLCTSHDLSYSNRNDLAEYCGITKNMRNICPDSIVCGFDSQFSQVSKKF